MTTVFAAIDLGPSSQRVLQHAAGFARLLSAQLRVAVDRVARGSPPLLLRTVAQHAMTDHHASVMLRECAHHPTGAKPRARSGGTPGSAGAMTTCLRAAALIVLGALAPVGAAAQEPAADVEAITAFQRAADAYAFTHRQTDRRGTTPERRVEGEFFTPRIAALFRSRIRAASLGAACAGETGGGLGFVVPRVNDGTVDTAPLAPCLRERLPKLPEELEYRTAGVVLVLADAHRHVVVDLLHAAFSREQD